MKSFVHRLTHTTPSTAALVLRVVLGIVMLPHGLQKTTGAFGGYGYNGTMTYFTTQGGLPWLVAFLVILGESLGSASLILGFLTRFCAGSLAVIMIGAASMHYGNGLFMNWTGTQQGEGFEYHLLVIAICVALVFIGGGRLSIDRVLSRGR